MLLRCAYLPIFFWLLLPPGICLCKYSRFFPGLFGRSTETQSALPSEPDTSREDDERDHAPWCPSNKMVYAHLPSGLVHTASVPLPFTLDLTLPAASGVGPAIPTEVVAPPGNGRVTTERYLILRALLL